MVLDFDGVLLDTERIAVTVWRDLLHDHSPRSRLRPTVRPDGTLDREAWRRCLTDRLGGRGTRRLWGEFERRNREQADLADTKSGVRPFLAHCAERGHRLAVASGNALDWVEGHLARLGIRSCFASVNCAGPGVRTKPAPDTYLQALECAPSPGSQVLAVEDSYTGLAAAHAAGLPSVWLTDAPLPAVPPVPVSRRVRTLDELIGSL
ncbi:HAD family hydrolase [Streptomyces spinosus]|uniref:HAD family hydrolase n=1 Tax=Streptomyces spinosus TaxID=2872623 RepID=UPI0027E1020F|nr:HAD-IA family hydrolase [Streptomyces spinosus]